MLQPPPGILNGSFDVDLSAMVLSLDGYPQLEPKK